MCVGKTSPNSPTGVAVLVMKLLKLFVSWLDWGFGVPLQPNRHIPL